MLFLSVVICVIVARFLWKKLEVAPRLVETGLVRGFMPENERS